MRRDCQKSTSIILMPINATNASEPYMNEGDSEGFVQCFDNREHAADSGTLPGAVDELPTDY